MKIGKREISWLVALVGVLAAAVTYMMVFTPRQEETEALERENATLQTRINQLEEWKKEEPMYEEESAKMIADMKNIFNIFPEDVLEEDAILYAAKLEARNSNTDVTKITIDDPYLAYEIGPTNLKITEKDQDREGEHSYQLYNTYVVYTHQYSYNGMKQFVKDIAEDADRRPISGVVVKYDSTSGLLVGSTGVNVLALRGNDRVYQKEDITGVPAGTKNIFGTITSPSETVATDTEE